MRPTRVRPRLSSTRRREVTRRLTVELMEPRCLLSTFTVVNTNDSGTGSLRQAMLDANAHANDSPALPDKIQFAIPQPNAGSQLVTIHVLSPLPTLTDAVIVDGYSEPGTATNKSVGGFDEQETDVAVLNVQVDGSQAGANANGFTVATVNTTIDGLCITGFKGAAIELDPGATVDSGTIGSTIWGNYIGISSWDPNSFNDMTRGVNPEANGQGILVKSSNNVIGGTLPVERNIVQDNNGPGVELTGTTGTGNLVETNFILDNVGDGVLIENSNNSIGEPVGPGPANAGNVISGNLNGVHLVGANAKGNIVENNEIGTEVGLAGVLPLIRGLNPRGNLLNGVYIEDAPGNDIGGLIANSHNVIAANGLDGVSIQNVNTQGATGNRVLGNWIGYNLRGNTISRMPSRDGVNISSAYNVVGGDSDAARNTIIANSRNGVTISGHTFDVNDNIIPGGDNPMAQPSFNVVAGNYIGTQGGVEDLGNALDGVLIDDAPNNTVGGTDAASRNVIVGNNDGVVIRDHAASGNTVSGNFIGTMSDGVSARGNSLDGVRIVNAPNNVVGGTAAGAGNVISGNNTGIQISGSGSTQDLVEGNFIGTDLTAKIEVHNSLDGVLIDGNASNNTVGGTLQGAGNTIAYNVGNGVNVLSGIDNAILTNGIFNNNKLGIDLGGDGVTANHTGSATGPDNLQNYPVLTSVTPNGPGINVQGTMSAAPNTVYTVQFFSNLSLDKSGYGQGGQPIGQVFVKTDANGNAGINADIATPVPSGQFVTGTATDPNGNTSEFSNSLPAVPVTIQFDSSTYTADVQNGTATVTVTRSGGTGGQVSVAYATSDGTAKAGTDYDATSGTLTFQPGQTTQVFTIPVHNNNKVGNADLTVKLALSAPTGGATLGTNATATLDLQVVNQLQMQFSGAAYTATESDGSATITVTRNTLHGASSVDFATAPGGTAVPGTDYQPVSGTINFADGQDTQTFTIPLPDPHRFGGTETVNLALGNPQGGTLGPASGAVLTIQDTDAPGTLQFSQNAFGANGLGGVATLVVTRLGGSSGQVTVHYSTGGGSAVAGQDYSPTSGNLTFNPGETSKTIAVPLVANPQATGQRTFNVTLSQPGGGATLGPVGQATVTITPAGSLNGPVTGPGPVITGTQLGVSSAGITSIVLTFNEPIDPSSAVDLGNYGYFLFTPAAGGAFGAPGGGSIPLRSAAYDASTNRVILTPAIPVPVGLPFELNINQKALPGLGVGITDTSGVLLDGAGNGGSGTPYTAIFTVGSSVSYVDAAGNSVSLKLSRGGLIELNRGANGNAQAVQIVGAAAGQSVLSGQVRHGRHGRGSTPIPHLAGGGAIVRLKSPQFVLGQVSAAAVDAILAGGPGAKRPR